MPKILIVCGIANVINDYKYISIFLEKVFGEKDIDKKNDIYIINSNAISTYYNIHKPDLLYSKKSNIMNYDLTSKSKLIYNKFDYIIFNFCTYTIHKDMKIYDLLYKNLNNNGKLIIHYSEDITKYKNKKSWSYVENIIVKNKLVKYINNIFNNKIQYKKIKLSNNSKYEKWEEYNKNNYTKEHKMYLKIIDEIDNIFINNYKEYLNNKVELNKFINEIANLRLSLFVKRFNISDEKFINDHKKWFIMDYKDIIKKHNRKYKQDKDEIYQINYWVKM